MKKLISVEAAAQLVRSGDRVMINGFLGVKNPDQVIEAMIEAGIEDLTVIANDSSTSNKGIGRLIAEKRVKKLITSHIGLNADTGKQMNEGSLLVDLVPQGTLVEQIRCGGAGMGGFLTQTGLGTDVAKGKTVIELGGKSYLLEEAMQADVAIIKGSIVDEMGNVYYKGTTKNFSLVMAMAAKCVIVEAEKIVPVGELSPEEIMTPGIFVDYVVGGTAHE